MGHIDVIKSVFLALFGAFFCTLALGEPVGGAARDAAGDPAGADKQVTEEVVEVDDIDDSAAGIESCSQSTQPPPGVARVPKEDVQTFLLKHLEPALKWGPLCAMLDLCQCGDIHRCIWDMWPGNNLPAATPMPDLDSGSESDCILGKGKERIFPDLVADRRSTSPPLSWTKHA